MGTSCQLSFNLGEKSLIHTEYLTKLRNLCEKYGRSPTDIVLEVLENIPPYFDELIISFIKEAKEIGFQIALDDYGTEYNTWERLNILLPYLSWIKLDKKYAKMLTDIDTQNEIRGVVHLAHKY